MKGFFKNLTALFLVLTIGIFTVEMPVSNVKAEEAVTEEAIKGDDFLKEVIGEYVPLFIGGIFNSEYDHYWHDYSAAVAGESMADMCVGMLKGAIGGTTYGENAGEEFYCGFTADVASIEFGGNDGTEVTFTLNSGKTITHKYSFVKNAEMTGNHEGQEVAMEGRL